VPTSGAVRFVSSVSFRLRRQGRENCGEMAGRAYGKTVWSWPSLLRSSFCGGGSCVNRRDAGEFREGEGGQRELGSRESTAYAVQPSRREGRVIGYTCMLLCGFLRVLFAQRTAGAGWHPAFPAPSWLKEGWR
jgi:hypothetical protein